LGFCIFRLSVPVGGDCGPVLVLHVGRLLVLPGGRERAAKVEDPTAGVRIG
jgi:hypothetical protein